MFSPSLNNLPSKEGFTKKISIAVLTLKAPGTKIAESTKGIDLDKAAHHEPPYQDQHRLYSSV